MTSAVATAQAPKVPWPLPRLHLTATVDPTQPDTAVLTVTNGKADQALIDPGDGTQALTVPLTDGTGSIAHTYNRPGHHTYTATATAACPVRYGTWAQLAGAVDPWSAVVGDFDTWADGTRTAESATTEVTVDVGKATVTASLWSTGGPGIRADVWIGDPATVTSWTLARICPEALAELNTVVYLTDAHPGGYTVIDHEAPLGVAVSYHLTVTYTDGTQFETDSNQVTITGTRGCWLTSTLTGTTLQVTVQAWDERTRAARQAVLAIAGRPDPVVLSDTHLLPSGTVTFFTRTRADLHQLTSLLTAARLVLLRTQPRSSVPTAYLAVGQITETRTRPDNGTSWERLLSVDVQEVAPVPFSARTLSTRWDQVPDTWTAWTDVPERMPTWADLGQWTPTTTAKGTTA